MDKTWGVVDFLLIAPSLPITAIRWKMMKPQKGDGRFIKDAATKSPVTN